MTSTATRSIPAPPTLFRLRRLAGRPAAAVQLAELRDEHCGVETGQGDGGLTLRIDPPLTLPRTRQTPISNPERRLDVLTKHRPRRRPVSADPRRHADRSPRPNLFVDHAGDLIHRLSQWSLQLDRREAELDHRESDLNRRERLLRQSESGSFVPNEDTI